MVGGSLSPFSTNIYYLGVGVRVKLLFLSSTLFSKMKVNEEKGFTMLSTPLILIIYYDLKC